MTQTIESTYEHLKSNPATTKVWFTSWETTPVRTFTPTASREDGVLCGYYLAGRQNGATTIDTPPEGEGTEWGDGFVQGWNMFFYE